MKELNEEEMLEINGGGHMLIRNKLTDGGEGNLPDAGVDTVFEHPFMK